MFRFASVLFVAFVAMVSISRAEVVIDGERKIPANSFAELTVKGASNIVWQILPEPVKASRRGGWLYIGGVPGTTYTVSAVVVDFEKKSIEAGEVKITFEGAAPIPVPPTPPTPGPGPNPPPTPAPTDLTSKFAATIKADGVSPETVRKYAEFLNGGVADENVKAFKTPRELLRQMRTVIAATINDDKIDNLKTVVDAEINKRIAGRENADIDPDLRELIKSIIRAVVEALLEAIKK